MSHSPRIADALATLDDDRRRLDAALYRRRTLVFAALSAWIAAGFIGSCLVASAPPLEAVISGLALGLAAFGMFHLRLWVVDRLTDPAASESPANREPQPRCESDAVRHRRPRRSRADRVPAKGA